APDHALKALHRNVTRIASLLLLVLAAGCRLFSSDLGEIAAHPFHFHGQEGTVEGRVEAVRWMPQVGAMGFRLVDGSHSLLVTTQARPAREGAHVGIPGRVQRTDAVGEGVRVVLRVLAPPRSGNGDVR